MYKYKVVFKSILERKYIILMAKKIISFQIENKPHYMVYFKNEVQLRDMPFNELTIVKERHNLREEFDEIKRHRRKLRSRYYSMISRDKKLKELSSLEKYKEDLLSEQKELELEIKQLKENLTEK